MINQEFQQSLDTLTQIGMAIEAGGTRSGIAAIRSFFPEATLKEAQELLQRLAQGPLKAQSEAYVVKQWEESQRLEKSPEAAKWYAGKTGLSESHAGWIDRTKTDLSREDLAEFCHD